MKCFPHWSQWSFGSAKLLCSATAGRTGNPDGRCNTGMKTKTRSNEVNPHSHRTLNNQIWFRYKIMQYNYLCLHSSQRQQLNPLEPVKYPHHFRCWLCHFVRPLFLSIFRKPSECENFWFGRLDFLLLKYSRKTRGHFDQ